MTLYAFKQGVTVLNETNLNSLMSLQDFYLAYDGSSFYGLGGSGVKENSMAAYSYCVPFMTMAGITEVSRVALELDKDGQGADIILQVRQGMAPATGTEGTILRQVVIPKEFIPINKAWVSVPLGVTGLVSPYGLYYLTMLKAGDSVNKIDWVGESVQNPDIQVFMRAGASGAWSTMSQPGHFHFYSGTEGELRHCLYGGTGYSTLEYDGQGQISKVKRFLPPEGGGIGGIRNIMSYTWAGESLVKGVLE